ncbi:cytosine permease [Cryobacterium sp. N19]|uniref:cytosine permease n=1 Tax=Cryobacterium sp. N19 TaxID=2048288 RepID=UPI000CE4F816|nr:cytosine permease [Cryobacterium sp. N19]
MSRGSVTAATDRGTAAAGAPGYRIALILLGIVVTPVMLSAPTLGSGLTLGTSITAIIVGSVILLIVGATTLSIGQHARQSTYDIVRFSFGAKGARAINVLLAVSLFGWTAVTANGFGVAVQSLLIQLFDMTVPLPYLVVLGCVIFVTSTAFGFKILGNVAQFAVPVIVLILAFLVYQALNSALTVLDPVEPISWGVAVSSVVGTAIVLVVTAADFGSFTRNRRQAILAAILAFGIAYPCLYIGAAIPSAYTGESTLINAMTLIASGLPAIVLLIIAAVTANAGNIFQGTLAISTLVTALRKWQITVGIGVAAAIVGSFDLVAWLPSFLLFLGIAAPPVAGIFVADFFLHRRTGYDNAVLTSQSAIKLQTFAAWFIGSVIGYLTAYNVFSLTGISSIDSMLISALVYVAASTVMKTTRNSISK